MSCKNCKFEFCWVCMEDWKEHNQQTGGFFKCNKYDPKKKTKGKDGKEVRFRLQYSCRNRFFTNSYPVLLVGRTARTKRKPNLIDTCTTTSATTITTSLESSPIASALSRSSGWRTCRIRTHPRRHGWTFNSCSKPRNKSLPAAKF